MSVPQRSTLVAGEAFESDDDSTTVIPSAVSMEHRPSLPVTVVSGEASESDDETDQQLPPNIPPSLHVSSTVSASSPSTTSSLVTKLPARPSYDSLLHRKLRETNIAMRESLDVLLRRQYDAATKNLRSTAQQLSSSQQIVQDISYTMRLLTNNLFQLEDKIDIVVTCPILPQINTL